jgi:hypothetical protein
MKRYNAKVTLVSKTEGWFVFVIGTGETLMEVAIRLKEKDPQGRRIWVKKQNLTHGDGVTIL